MPFYVATGQVAGNEASSTYEGRHVTILESLLTHPVNAGNLVFKGDPVCFGDIGVGVAFNQAAAATDYIALDTEGIWWQTVYGTDEWGSNAVAMGDRIYINETTCLLSKNSNKNTHRHFGYAITTMGAGLYGICAVKVHFDPDDAEELVGVAATPYTSATAGKRFRDYRYKSTAAAGDEIRGQYTSLELAGAQNSGGEAQRGRTILSAIVGGGVHGGHFGIEFATGGKVTGLGVGLRGTLLHKNAAHAGGTIAGGMSELFAEGDATNYAGAAEHSIHRFVNDGEATGKATAQNVFSFAGLSATQNQAHNAWVAGLTRSLRVIVDGAVFYIGLSNAP